MIGIKLKEIREKTGMNKKEFAEHLGLKYTTYNNYETGAREPSSDFLVLVSSRFDVSIDYLLGIQDDREVLHTYRLRHAEYEHVKKYRELDDFGRETVDLAIDREFKRMQIARTAREEMKRLQDEASSQARSQTTTRVLTYLHKMASAGHGEYMFTDIPTDTIEVPLTTISSEADFVIGVNGDSMEPTYLDGDKVLVQKVSEIASGEIGIFIQGNECYIKEVGNGCLISHNKAYPDITHTDDIRVIGKVLGKIA